MGITKLWDYTLWFVQVSFSHNRVSMQGFLGLLECLGRWYQLKSTWKNRSPNDHSACQPAFFPWCILVHLLPREMLSHLSTRLWQENTDFSGRHLLALPRGSEDRRTHVHQRPNIWRVSWWAIFWDFACLLWLNWVQFVETVRWSSRAADVSVRSAHSYVTGGAVLLKVSTLGSVFRR